MENFKFIFEALELALKDNALTIQYLRDELKKAEEKAATIIVENAELKAKIAELEKTIEKQAQEIKNLEGDLDFYKPANCKTEGQAQ